MRSDETVLRIFDLNAGVISNRTEDAKQTLARRKMEALNVPTSELSVVVSSRTNKLSMALIGDVNRAVFHRRTTHAVPD